jgi:hypothetical protein
MTTPAAPTPPATPAKFTGAPLKTLQSVHADLTAEQFSAMVNSVPATPQSLLQIISAYVTPPEGVAAAEIRDVNCFVNPSGSARIVVQYLH